MTTGTIKLSTPDGSYLQDITAILFVPFGLHKSIDSSPGDNLFTITHIPTGGALLSNVSLLPASKALTRLCLTLTDKQITDLYALDTAAKANKSRLMKKCYKYLKAAIRCENNCELEDIVGVFYKDRMDAEKLRVLINPKAAKGLDPRV